MWIGVLVGIAGLLIPVFPGKAVYVGVGPAQGERIIRTRNVGPFVLDNGRLYLLQQRTWHALLLVSRVERREWNAEQCRELRLGHPELEDERLWDGGDK